VVMWRKGGGREGERVTKKKKRSWSEWRNGWGLSMNKWRATLEKGTLAGEKKEFKEVLKKKGHHDFLVWRGGDVC